jgi:hypothetical protein
MAGMSNICRFGALEVVRDNQGPPPFLQARPATSAMRRGDVVHSAQMKLNRYGSVATCCAAGLVLSGRWSGKSIHSGRPRVGAG